jgi:glycosyltransferase involved in cell wall biosynthesis
VKRPAVIYWNNIPSPYFVGRLNALAGRGNIDLSAWFNRRREPDRSWNVDEGSFEFRYSYLSDRRNSLDLFRKLKHESPDVLVSLYNTPQFVAVSLWASALGIRTAYRVLPTFDAWVTRSIFKEFIKHAIFRFVDGVKVPGPDGARTAERYGVPASRIFPVTQSIDVRHFASARELGTAERLRIRESLGLRGCVFLYVGRLWAGKGLDYLLQAYQTVSAKCQDVSLLIVGDGVDEARFRTAAQGLPRVAFAGYVQVEELARYYAASDAMVFPTLGDPHGLVVEEAMAAGLPVISSNAAGDIRARVPEGKAGYVVEAGNAEALGERMIRLAENPALRMAMGSKAHEQVSALTHEKWADDFERFVGCLLAMSKRRVLI